MKFFKKTLPALLLAAAAACSLAACAPQTSDPDTGSTPGQPSGPEQPAGPDLPANGSDILIVYFSWSTSNNTGRIAEYIGQQTGGTVHELIPAVPYPTTPYTQWGDLAREERDSDARPAIADPLSAETIAQYDAVFVGYPIWWHTAPMIIGTFLEAYDWNGTDIYPFSQSASMNTEQFSNSMDFVRRCAKGATVHEGLFARPSATSAIDDYLAANGFIS